MKMPSKSRPHKPPAKELARRKAAALSSGGGRLPSRIRVELDRERMREHEHQPGEAGGGARYGKREPKAGRHDRASEIRDAIPSRRGGNRPPDPGTRRSKEARRALRP